MFSRILQIAVPFVWFGAAAAISFMEAPLKFTAPGITLELGLGIGQIVFHMLNRIELFLCTVLAAAFLFGRPRQTASLLLFGAVAFLLLVQTFVLFPLLDERTAAVLAGTAEPFSHMHFYYIGAEAVKLILLAALGAATALFHLRTSANSSPSR